MFEQSFVLAGPANRGPILSSVLIQVTAVGFLLAALVCGRLAGQFRAQLRLLRAANERGNDLQRFVWSGVIWPLLCNQALP